MWLAAALLLQAEFMHFFTIRAAEPSAVLVLVVWFAMRTNLMNAAAFGVIAGACEDFFGTQTGGAWTIATTLTAIGANFAARGFFVDSLALTAVVVASAALLRRLLFWTVMSLEGYPAGFARVHFHQAMWEALADAVLAIAVTLGARAISSRRFAHRY